MRVVGSNTIGTIEKIEKKKVEINYGFFTTKTTIDKLEFVEKIKKIMALKIGPVRNFTNFFFT